MSSHRQILAEKMKNKNHEGLLKHPFYLYIHIWEVVALSETQTNYDYGPSSLT